MFFPNKKDKLIKSNKDLKRQVVPTKHTLSHKISGRNLDYIPI